MADFTSSNLSLDGNNYIRFFGSYTRVGSKLNITLKIKSRWTLIVDVGWQLGIYNTNNVPYADKWVNDIYIGSNTVEWQKEYTIYQSLEIDLKTNAAVSLRLGNVQGLIYNGVSRGSKYYTLNIPASNITPGKPVPNLNWGKGTYYDYKSGSTTTRLYAAYREGSVIDDKTYNSLGVTCGMPGSATSLSLFIDKYVGGSWAVNVNGDNKTSISKSFAQGDAGYEFRVRSISKSSTGHTTNGDTVNFRINPIPTMTLANIKLNTNKTENNVILTWSHLTHSYCYDADRRYRIHLYKYDNAKKDYFPFKTITAGNETSKVISLLSNGFAASDKAKIYIEPGTKLEWAKGKYYAGIVTVNSAPSFTNGSVVSTSADSDVYAKYFLNSVTVSWPAAIDPQNDPLTYKLRCRSRDANNAWGAWSDVASNLTSRSYTGNFQNSCIKGKGIQFEVVASDSDFSSNAIYSQEIFRDIEPPAPTNLVIDPVSSKNHYETINRISWTKSIAANKKDCTKYKVKKYICSTQSISGIRPVLDIETSTTSLNTDISDANRGQYIIWEVTAIDQFGLSSTTALYSKYCKKNVAPTAPRDFRVNSSKPNLFKTVPLVWTPSTDAEGDAITYTLYVSYNNSSYSIVREGLTATTFNHDISLRSPNDSISYKIVAIDSFGAKSPEVYISNKNLVVNTKPNPPVFVYPTRFVYDRRPRILLRTNGDANSDTLAIKVKIGSNEYNSLTNGSCFNKSSFSSSNDKIVFIPPTNLPIGRTNISIKANDGLEDSNETNIVIECVEPNVNLSGTNDVLITKDIMDKLITMASNSRKAYGLSEYTKTINKNDLITYGNFNELYGKAVDVTTWINTNYPGKNKTKNKPSITKSSLIVKEIPRSILEIITNL